MKQTSRKSDESGKSVVLMNTVLAGIPAAYAVTGSMQVTMVAAVTAVVVTVAQLVLR